MDRATLGDVQLEYELRGNGEPVLLVHPGIFADWFTPLLHEASLTRGYRLVHYHRVGCVGSSRVAGPVSLSLQASHARSLLQHLDVRRAHVVGHSSGANVALQFALEFPELVQSLALLEPALMSVPSAAQSRTFVGTALQLYRAGDEAGAIDTFLRGTCGPGYRTDLDRVLPGAFDQHVADAATFFEQELPALQQWTFRREEAQRVTSPALAVVGARSLETDRIWQERHDLLLDWLPNVEPLVIPEASHLLQVAHPAAIARGLAAFFGHHPLVAQA